MGDPTFLPAVASAYPFRLRRCIACVESGASCRVLCDTTSLYAASILSFSSCTGECAAAMGCRTSPCPAATCSTKSASVAPDHRQPRNAQCAAGNSTARSSANASAHGTN
eukprot:1231935-Pyramimonas_sp.AAC.1